ncbi:PGM2 [Mytilus edulis]|uniref:PGM2 n=1 Tax=Mytilus edulis TaxID=6550 RepID=A0A8S3S6C2_MYTED|nr:PGM2 [Mytilus edulis]
MKLVHCWDGGVGFPLDRRILMFQVRYSVKEMKLVHCWDGGVGLPLDRRILMFQKNPDVPASEVYMLASTVSSKILQTIARNEGFNFEETLTGFKWMGNKSDEYLKAGKTVLFAFEEAIGFMCGSSVLDKDGVSASMVTAEMATHLYDQGLTLYKQLENIYQKYGYHISLNSYFICHDKDVIKKLFDDLRNFNGTGKHPDTCGPYKIKYVRDLTVGIDNSKPDNIPTLPVSKSSQMVTYTFENGCVATLRTSGTEPKIKYYTEHKPDPQKGLDKQSAQHELEDIVQCIITYFLQPEKYNLQTRSSVAKEIKARNSGCNELSCERTISTRYTTRNRNSLPTNDQSVQSKQSGTIQKPVPYTTNLLKAASRKIDASNRALDVETEVKFNNIILTFTAGAYEEFKSALNGSLIVAKLNTTTTTKQDRQGLIVEESISIRPHRKQAYRINCYHTTSRVMINDCAQLQDFLDLEPGRGGDNIISDDDEVTKLKTLYVSPGKHNTSNMLQDIQTTNHSEKQGCKIGNQISEKVSQNTALTSENRQNVEKRGTIHVSQKHIDQPMNVTHTGTCSYLEKQSPQPRMNILDNLRQLTLLTENHQETQTCPSLLPHLGHEHCKRDIDKKTKETREHATKLRKVETELAQYKSQLSTTKSYIASLELKLKEMEDSNRNLKTKIRLMQDNNPKITSDQQTSQHVDSSNDIKLLLHEQRIRQLEHENLKVSIRMEKLETLSSMNLPHTKKRNNKKDKSHNIKKSKEPTSHTESPSCSITNCLSDTVIDQNRNLNASLTQTPIMQSSEINPTQSPFSSATYAQATNFSQCSNQSTMAYPNKNHFLATEMTQMKPPWIPPTTAQRVPIPMPVMHQPTLQMRSYATQMPIVRSALYHTTLNASAAVNRI